MYENVVLYLLKFITTLYQFINFSRAYPEVFLGEPVVCLVWYLLETPSWCAKFLKIFLSRLTENAFLELFTSCTSTLPFFVKLVVFVLILSPVWPSFSRDRKYCFGIYWLE